jgi:hypothetical protein
LDIEERRHCDHIKYTLHAHAYSNSLLCDNYVRGLDVDCP